MGWDWRTGPKPGSTIARMDNHSHDQHRHMRSSAVAWAERPWNERLQLVGRVSAAIAARAEELVASVHRPAATPGEILASEVLPLAEACRYLAKHGRQILKPQALSRRGRAWWMGWYHRYRIAGIVRPCTGHRPVELSTAAQCGTHAAGTRRWNAVLVKPAPRCEQCMHVLHSLIASTGIPEALVKVLESRPEAATSAIDQGVDKLSSPVRTPMADAWLSDWLRA